MAPALALLASVLYGLGDFLGGIASRRQRIGLVLLISQAAALILLISAAFAIGSDSLTGNDIAASVAAGIGTLAGLGLLYTALSRGPIAMVAPVTAVVAIVIPVIFSALTEHLPLAGPVRWGIALTLIAVCLSGSGGNSNESRRAKGSVAITFLLALAAGVAITLFYIAIKQASPAAGIWPLVIARIIAFVGACVAALSAGRPVELSRHDLLLSIGAGMADGLANTLYLLAVSVGSLDVVVPLASLYPATTMFLALVILKERLAAVQWLGGAFALGACVLMSQPTL